jgi:hypothetical protein
LTTEAKQSLNVYSRELHDYTLVLWTESRRLAAERAEGKAQARRERAERRAARAAASSEDALFIMPPRARRPPTPSVRRTPDAPRSVMEDSSDEDAGFLFMKKHRTGSDSSGSSSDSSERSARSA